VNDLIVDASVAIKWFVDEDDSDIADSITLSGARLFAPQILVSEVANALSRKVTQQRIKQTDAVEILSLVPGFLSGLLKTDDLLAAAFNNACRYAYPIYDFIYLEAAIRLGCKMLTADRPFLARLKGTDMERSLILLSEWPTA
jgi:predicted nucleic acid-binding protein